MKKWSDIIVLLLLFGFVAFFHFYKLTYLPFRVWDEARLATSAYEMSKTGNLLVTTINYAPDLVGTKPPMMIWAEALCVRLFGISEWSIRIPSGLLTTLTIILAFIFVERLTKSRWSALITAIVLCTARGYLFDHGSRYGEYESMLIFFNTNALLSFFLFTEAPSEKKSHWLLLFFLFLTFAALTKGVAALLFAPSLAIYLVVRKQFIAILCNQYFYLGTLFFIVVVGAYYCLRELKCPGYLQAVADNELGGRFGVAVDGHIGPWSFYWDILKNEGFGNWYWAIPVALGLFWFFPNRVLSRFAGFCLLCSTGIIAILSASQTKLSWYAWPAIPLFAMIIGIVTDQLAGAASAVLPIRKQVAIIFFVIAFSIQPTLEAVADMNHLKDDLSGDNFYAASYYFRDAVYGKRDLKDYTYISGGWDMQWKLYVDWLNEAGTPVTCIEYWKEPKLKPGDKVIANLEASKNYVETRYTYNLVNEYYGVKNYIIISAKKESN